MVLRAFGTGSVGAGRRRVVACGATAVILLGLSGCGEGDGDVALRAAEAQVRSSQAALDEAEAAAVAARASLCEQSASYITAVDVYGDVLAASATTVGDVRNAGADLAEPRDEVAAAADAVRTADDGVEKAEADLAAAEAALAALQTVSPSESGESESEDEPEPESSLPAASVERVKRAEAEFAQAADSVGDDSTLREAGQQFNAAAVALEMAWLQLFANSGCLSDDQREQAVAAAAEYTVNLQQALSDAGYYDGDIDGVYGPGTVDGVQALQKAAGLPQTGAMDKATTAALKAAVAAKGDAEARSVIASTAAVQQTLTLTGHWTGPIDGEWTDELTDAVEEFQKDLGVEPTGEVDAATIKAFQDTLAELTATPSPTAEPPSESPTPAPPSEPAQPDATAS